ncbi:hypothetical protein J19TS2_30960 [Cohnella xylanilytica]|uniref:hypothetical protein n=1 Tax=Cohnella xylanilytica TaxID=557555 RepID=UPI001B0115B5|nr:hypothetical protein [Cohnella xylanilytica]GIO13541.1 hypothetical protein J19TS2_30960 [Cohnella xylanilytica]
MSDIFGGETIPVPGSSPEGHDETAAVETLEEEQGEEQYEADGHEVDEEAEGEDSEADEDQQEHSEQLLAGKYKTTEDLVRAYKELERKFHGHRQSGGQQQQPAQPPAPKGGQQDPNQAFWAAFRDNPMGTIQALVQHAATQQVAPLIEERQTETLGRHLDGLAKEYRQLTTDEGLQQFTAAIRDVAAELGNPDLARNPTPRMLRMAAQEAFGDSKARAYQRGKEAGRQESEQTRASKQGLGAKGGARPSKGVDPTPEQSIKEGILAAGKGGGGIFG